MTHCPHCGRSPAAPKASPPGLRNAGQPDLIVLAVVAIALIGLAIIFFMQTLGG